RGQGDVVDPGHEVKLARQPPDACERLGRVDRAVLDLKQDLDRRRLAEVLVLLEDVGDRVVARDEVGKRSLSLKVARDPRHADGEKGGQYGVKRQNRPSPAEQKVRGPLTKRSHRTN